MSFLNSWDFIDPRIAQNLIKLESKKVTLQNQKVSIHNDNKIKNASKIKLLHHTQQVQQKIKQLLKKEKQQLIDYYDKQIIVTTKQKYTQQNHIPSLRINKETYREEQSTAEYSKIMDQLKISAPVTTTSRGRTIDVRLKPNNNQEKQRDNKKHDKKQQINMKNVQIRRLKKMNNKKDKIIERLKLMLRLKQVAISDESSQKQSFLLYDQLEEYKQRDQQNEEYINLLKDKIEKLNLHHDKIQKQLRAKLNSYHQKLEQIVQNHEIMEDLKAQNEELRLQRQQLMNHLRRSNKNV